MKISNIFVSRLNECPCLSKVETRAANDPSVFTITEKVRTRAFTWLKVPFTFKTQLRHYAKAKRVLTHCK